MKPNTTLSPSASARASSGSSAATEPTEHARRTSERKEARRGNSIMPSPAATFAAHQPLAANMKPVVLFPRAEYPWMVHFTNAHSKFLKTGLKNQGDSQSRKLRNAAAATIDFPITRGNADATCPTVRSRAVGATAKSAARKAARASGQGRS